MSVDSRFAFHYDTEHERLHWTIETGSGEHVLDLIPGVLGAVAIQVDGRTTGHVPKPTPQQPWRDTRIEIDGEPIDVAVIFNRPALYTDVFRGGRSVRDRRTIDQARATAPRPASNYETWIGGLYGYRRPFRLPVLSTGMALLAIVCLLAIVGLFALVARPAGIVAAAVVFIALAVLFRIWLISWRVLTSRVHLALLSRPELGDTRRLAWFWFAFLGFPVLSVAVVVLLYGVARTLSTS